VDILKVKNPEKHNSFLNFNANLAIKKENSKDDKNYKQGVVFAEVSPNKFLFNIFWQGLRRINGRHCQTCKHRRKS